MNRSRALFAAAMLACLALAAAFRFPQLDLRPMHADEANQACKTGLLYESGEYQYDATDHHGPSLYWLTLPSLALSGAKDLAASSEIEYRVVPAIFGLALIAVLALLADGLGFASIAIAALLTAISPAMVYYSRYYIQEMLLVFFTMAAIGCGWRYLRSGRLAWMLAAGGAVGMMHATKETWILSAAATLAAAVTTWTFLKLASRWKSPLPASGGDPLSCGLHVVRTSRVCWHVAAGALVAIAVGVALFSLFGKNWVAPWDSIKAYANYFRRGSERGSHSEPWYYYLQILFAYRPAKQFFWSEGLIAVLAAVGAAYSILGLTKPQAPSRGLRIFLTFYTFFLIVVYSAISYKTPWCALSFLMGLILLAGVGAAAIFRALPNWPLKSVAGIVLTIAAAQLARQSNRLNFEPGFVADVRNPYVYAHTPFGLPRLCQRLDRLRERMPPGRELVVHVVVKENYWPLPWYLRKFKSGTVGYWLDPSDWQKDLAHSSMPDVLILSADVDSPELAARLRNYNGQIGESLRPGIFVRVYIHNELWPAFVRIPADGRVQAF